MTSSTLFTSTPLLPMALRVMQAARGCNWDVIEYQGGPLNRLNDHSHIAMYGDWRIICSAANALGISLLAPTANWLCELPEAYLSRQLRLTSWNEARKLTTPHFIKPIDWKSTKAKVYASGREVETDELIPSTARALISEPVRFAYEFRCFVLHRAVRAISPYYAFGETCFDGRAWVAPDSMFRDAKSFANKLLGDPRVDDPPAYTLDIGLIEGTGWAVVEAQPCWFSDLYGCDPYEVLAVLQRASPRQAFLTSDDANWIVRGSGLTAD